jgi:choline dehydrogenase
MISANLNASTMMIADKASDLVRGKAPPEAVRLPAARTAFGSGRDMASPR